LVKWRDSTPLVHLFRTLRAVVTSVAATAVGLTRTMTTRDGERAELKVGDRAPDFSLPGSDGRTYRLAELLGHGTIVVAWFPKAFTGG